MFFHPGPGVFLPHQTNVLDALGTPHACTLPWAHRILPAKSRVKWHLQCQSLRLPGTGRALPIPDAEVWRGN